MDRPRRPHFEYEYKTSRDREKEKNNNLDPFGINDQDEFLNENPIDENAKPNGTLSWLEDVDNLQLPSRTFYNEKKK